MNPARFPSCSSRSLSLSLYLLTRRQLSPVGFDPRGVYDLPVQSAFFRRFLREETREIYLGRFYCFVPSCAGRGVPSDASITGSELHPGSLRTGPTVSREERRRLERKRERERPREIPRGYPSDTLSAEVALHRGGDILYISRNFMDTVRVPWTRQEVRAHSRFYSIRTRGSENSSLFWRGRRIVVGKSEPWRPSYMDTRDMSSDVARVGIPKRGALFRSAFASSVSHVMLGDMRRREDEAGGGRGVGSRDCANGSNRIYH
ncbi:hypothetical protein ALC62_02788 [Cyphomyrmex costatus]|uniref:Uncharacterized protein n=1 Tax=Cyphomyrmex costatus TaxID=456900 RepID=A0A151IMX0_9HYME|nr:hypothetical protein ALC62_02788 [Cyphomyrmex costatus]